MERKKVLAENFKGLTTAEVCPYVEGEDNIKALWEKIKLDNKEGMVLKIKDSIYVFKRSNAWLKYKTLKEVDLKMDKYTINNAGIRLENKDGIAVQCSGIQSEFVKHQLDKNGEVTITMQYLEKTKDGKFRFPSFRKVVE
jgi:hypothetical protein